VPVTVATKLPAEFPVQDNFDVPEPPVIIVVERVQDRLVEVVVIPRVIVPVNPLVGLTVMVDVPATPALTVMVVGLALMLKSVTWKRTLTE
jgi:hypothetical protein